MCGGDLGRFSVGGAITWVGQIMWLFGCCVLDILENTFDVAWYGHFAGASLVVPLECETKVEPATPVVCGLV